MPSYHRRTKGYELSPTEVGRITQVTVGDEAEIEMGHGAVVIAAITSCTNTSDPSVMVGAGLLAKRAVERGLKVKPYVKTSLAPGSLVVTEYLESTGLLESLAELGFNIVGYGCTTCIGNSGPLREEVAKAVNGADLVAAAVLSGNRRRIVELAPVEVIFDAPLHPYTRALRSAMPEPDPDYRGEEIILEGEISTMAEWSRGCRFAPRCPAAKINRCYEEEPQLLDVGGGHLVACHLHHTI